MIVSASYRTDIPAFYGRWFADRWTEGFCEVPNPYSQKLYRVSLNPRDIDGMVFWTRSAKPFFKQFARVHEDGVPFVITHTVTGYGKEIEAGVPDWHSGVDTLHSLAETYGSDAVVWRYDPILFTDSIDADWHLRHFETLASAINGATDEVVVSFTQFYAKTKRNMALRGIAWHDPSLAEKQALLRNVASIAAKYGIQVTLCTQPELLIPEVKKARCIDLQRLWRVGKRLGRDPFKAKLKPTRPNCGCAESRDIGTFATCKFGCAYCYAK